MKNKNGMVAWLQYAALRLAIFLIHMFPVDANLRTARLLGRVWWHIDRRHRDRTREHLRLAYGDSLSDAEVDRIALRSMQHLVMLVIEMIFTPWLITDWTWARYVKLTDFGEALRILLDGHGAILVTGHYGNWELTGHLLALYGFEVLAIMRPLDNVYLNRYLVQTRRSAGLQLLDKKGATEAAEAALHRGAALGFIADQNAGHKGLFVDFFGRKASTYKSIGLLAMSAEVPIIVGCARRTGDRLHYELCAERIIRPEEWARRDDPLRWITQEYTAAIERFVRRDPSQYLWTHRRWKSRPKDEQTREPAGRVTSAAAAAT
ncbi:MAG TPA: lipid A biosynthesis acyltransferase [Phycisphaerae bacterium]|nr:lipid A biosynthesis acyltransferase [Phycisphaerae bacterium]